jgi:hypothetical protein
MIQSGRTSRERGGVEKARKVSCSKERVENGTGNERRYNRKRKKGMNKKEIETHLNAPAAAPGPNHISTSFPAA